jgi:hypothetical protein
MARGGRSEKLSSRARQLLSDVESGQRASEERVDLLIGVTAEGPQAREALERHGAEVRTMAGDVYTASAPLSALDRLADLDDVASIEASGELYPEERPPTG